jgi:CheY-like chemotaxis protein
MAQFDFSDVDVLLVDPDRGAQEGINMILRNNGFSKIRQGTTLAEIEVGFKELMPDILISECQLGGNGFQRLVHQMRHHEIGENPFLPVVALTAQPTPEIVKSVVNSGADDLISKPVSSAHLLKRIEALILARKPFVVTSEYIGPNRRQANDRPEEIPLIDVPNVLRIKAIGESEALINEQAIADAVDEINIQKLERYSIQIVWLIDRLVPMLQGADGDQQVEQFVNRLLYVAEDTSRRMVGTKYEHVSDLCQSLIKVTQNVRTSLPSPDTKDVRLLPQISKAIGQGFDREEGTAAAARAISASIGR